MNVGKSKVMRCTRNEDGARLIAMLNGEALNPSPLILIYMRQSQNVQSFDPSGST